MEKRNIPLSVPNFKGNELKYVTESIESEWVSTGGAFIDQFEDEISKYVGSKGAVSCQNGTSGIHIALELLGVSPEDEVLVPALTFIASVNPVKYVKSNPVFIDCDDSLCMDPIKLEDFIENECFIKDGKVINKKTNKRIKAIIVVHVFGNMTDMEEIIRISKKYGIKVIEDAAEALGTYYTEGKYKGVHAGTIGDIGIYSFNGNKIITSGGGGMIVSNNDDYLKRAKHLTTQAKSDTLYYTHDEIGYNYRITNLQAALGLAQLEQLEGFIKVKRDNYDLYRENLKDKEGLEFVPYRKDIRPNYWFYALKIGEEYPLKRDELISFLRESGIQSRPVWGLINQQKPYLENQTYKIDKAVYYLERIINIPCSSNLNKEEVNYVSEVLKEVK